MKYVKKAVFPVAGLGTRFLPVVNFFKWLQDSLKLEQCSANLERPRKQKFSLDGTRISAIWFLIRSKRDGFGILPR